MRLLPPPQVLDIACDIASGLAYLHPTIVHRDLKVWGNGLLLLAILRGMHSGGPAFRQKAIPLPVATWKAIFAHSIC